MNNFKIDTIVVIILLMFFSCTSKKESEQAINFNYSAKNEFDSSFNNPNTFKIKIDSIYFDSFDIQILSKTIEAYDAPTIYLIKVKNPLSYFIFEDNEFFQPNNEPNELMLFLNSNSQLQFQEKRKFIKEFLQFRHEKNNLYLKNEKYYLLSTLNFLDSFNSIATNNCKFRDSLNISFNNQNTQIDNFCFIEKYKLRLLNYVFYFKNQKCYKVRIYNYSTSKKCIELNESD